MKYINARAILPEALVRELQRYLQGGYLYVPADPLRQKRWGKRPATGRNWRNGTVRLRRNTGTGPLWTGCLKNIVCPCMRFGKLSIKNRKGAAAVQPLFVCTERFGNVWGIEKRRGGVQ